MYVNMYVCTHICTFYHISPYPHDIPVASTPIPATPSASPRHADSAVAGRPLHSGPSLLVHLMWSGHTDELTMSDMPGKSLDQPKRSLSTVST